MTNSRITAVAVSAIAFSARLMSHADAFAFNPTRQVRFGSSTSLEARRDSLDDVMASAGKAFVAAALALAVFNPSPAVADGTTVRILLENTVTSFFPVGCFHLENGR